jgi:hypothetical protein
MKNILIAIVIVLAAIGACNPPQKSTTDNTSDSTATNKSTRDTTMSTRDTTMSTRDTTHRDTSMHK